MKEKTSFNNLCKSVCIQKYASINKQAAIPFLAPVAVGAGLAYGAYKGVKYLYDNYQGNNVEYKRKPIKYERSVPSFWKRLTDGNAKAVSDAFATADRGGGYLALSPEQQNLFKDQADYESQYRDYVQQEDSRFTKNMSDRDRQVYMKLPEHHRRTLRTGMEKNPARTLRLWNGYLNQINNAKNNSPDKLSF